MSNREDLRRCSACVMDDGQDPNIVFDDSGICNYCHDYITTARKELPASRDDRERRLAAIVEEIKSRGRGRRYDCAIGISGGVDSTYLAYQAKNLGLRALAIHFDNGWNSELAVKNIEQVVTLLGFDLSTYVVDWSEFRDIQLAYLRASVVDIEAITDHGIGAAVMNVALRNDIKYVLSGANVVSEAILPTYWFHDKGDAVNLMDIHEHFGKIPLKTFPICGALRRRYLRLVGIRTVRLLNLLDYHPMAAKKEIAQRLNWRDYGGKHYESVFTRFYQGHILPVKFGIDKRKAHLSSLILSGQMTRQEALSALQEPIYPRNQYEADRAFVLKKLGLNDDQFEQIMTTRRREHAEFATETSLFKKLPGGTVLEPIWRALRRRVLQLTTRLS